jgi:CRISPR-associated protein Cas1
LLSAEAEACLYTIGLDPAIGFYHEPTDRRPSLALDIVEPFRAPLADAMALDLLTHGILNPQSHFDHRDGGVYLNVEGRKRFFVAYERRMEREFTSEQHGNRTTLRTELRNQCRAVKKAAPVLAFPVFVPAVGITPGRCARQCESAKALS